MTAKVTLDVNPHVARKILPALLNADIHYQLAGTPHATTLRAEARKYKGQANRLLLQVANLGPDAATRMDFFMGDMT